MVYTRLMCNYFSIGVESRIGIGFDKSRTGSACCNQAVYGWEGLKKMCCTPRTNRINEVIDHMSSVDKDTGIEKIIFATGLKTQSDHYINGSPVSFVCTNINQMMGGKAKMWESGKGKNLGISDKNGQAMRSDSMKMKDQSTHDDDQLEFAIISSVIHLALGKGQRVA